VAASEIILELNDADQLLVSRDSLFYGKRMLNADAEEFIIEEAAMTSPKDDIHLRIHFRKNEISRKDEISIAIRQHFNYRRKKSRRQLKKTLDLGWRSLLMSIVFFGLLVLLTFVIMKLFPEGTVSLTLRELLIIGGWVALWRPIDLLLYEWRPFLREVHLFRKIEQCKVDVVAG
jgi:hypothetical protein